MFTVEVVVVVIVIDVDVIDVVENVVVDVILYAKTHVCYIWYSIFKSKK